MRIRGSDDTGEVFSGTSEFLKSTKNQRVGHLAISPVRGTSVPRPVASKQPVGIDACSPHYACYGIDRRAAIASVVGVQGFDCQTHPASELGILFILLAQLEYPLRGHPCRVLPATPFLSHSPSAGERTCWRSGEVRRRTST